MSGVLPTDNCKTEFTNLQHKRLYNFITFKIDSEKGVTEVCEVHKREVRFGERVGDGREEEEGGNL